MIKKYRYNNKSQLNLLQFNSIESTYGLNELEINQDKLVDSQFKSDSIDIYYSIFKKYF